MRAPAIRAVVCVAIPLAGAAAVVACGDDSSNDNNSNNPPPPEAGLEADATAPHDGGARFDGTAGEGGDAADADAAPDGPVTCSDAGWCLTPLPDVDLQFTDIAPFANSAIALATSPSRGTKVLEWDDATNQWAYLDVGPIDLDSDTYALSFWAPSQDEFYLSELDYTAALQGGSIAYYMYHATRPTPPATTWAWARYQLPSCGGLAIPEVWGSSSADIYLMYCSAIYRLTNDADAGPSDAGPSEADSSEAGPLEAGPLEAGLDGSTATSTAEYVDDDPTDTLSWAGGAGTGPDDAWFTGVRGGACGFVVRKTSAGYKRIADGVVAADGSCTAKPGFLMFDVGNAVAGSIDVRAIGANQLFSVWAPPYSTDSVIRIVDNGGGSYTVSQSNPSPVFSVDFTSIWGMSEDDLWLIVSLQNNAGAIMHGTNVWSDGGVYRYSTLVLNGAPNPNSLARIRGTSDSNIWAVGDTCAYHKTTP